MKNDLNLSVMLDCSRNAVMKLSQLKEFALILSRMGYKELYLYTEDTYEIKGEDYFGYLRGKYTQEELKELDAYCQRLGIILVPCIQVLAHLGSIFRWTKYFPLQDINDILLVDDERTYELIDKMFDAIAKIFTVRKVNIGFDEAHNIGRGKFLDKNGHQLRYEILVRHLNKVKEIADKYGFRIEMWSDMFFRVANHCEYTYEGLDEEILAKAAKDLPEGINVLYWEYYSTQNEKYDKMFALHKKYFQNIAFAGGAIEWLGYVPLNEESLKIAKVAMNSVRKNNIKDVMVTLWGDGGGQCSFYSVLPTLFYYKELAEGNDDVESIKEKFAQITGEDFDAFIALDLPNKIGNHSVFTANPSLYMLYNDYFSGVFDCTVAEGDGKKYKEYAKIIKRYAKGKYSYIFNVVYRLCDVLSVKYELGVKTRVAYRKKDQVTLKGLIKEYEKLPGKIASLLAAYEKQWLIENKTTGIEVEQIRLGGLISRTKFCAKLIKQHLKTGEKIAELEEPLLDFYGNGTNLLQQPIQCNEYQLCASVNPLYHGM
jgi:hypothetical protein